jgi:hypothetical protein
MQVDRPGLMGNEASQSGDGPGIAIERVTGLEDLFRSRQAPSGERTWAMAQREERARPFPVLGLDELDRRIRQQRAAERGDEIRALRGECGMRLEPRPRARERFRARRLAQVAHRRSFRMTRSIPHGPPAPIAKKS